jgi:hypothetical protein
MFQGTGIEYSVRKGGSASPISPSTVTTPVSVQQTTEAPSAVTTRVPTTTSERSTTTTTRAATTTTTPSPVTTTTPASTTSRQQPRVEQTTLDWLDVKFDVGKVHGKVVDLNKTVSGVINHLINATSLLYQFGDQLSEVVGNVKNVTKAVFDSVKTSWSTTELLAMGLVTLLVGLFIGVTLSTLSVSQLFFVFLIRLQRRDFRAYSAYSNLRIALICD